MPKLKRARHNAAAPATPARAPSLAAPPPSSSRRPPSLLSTSTRASPLALRSVGALAPAVSASTVEAHGELVEGNGSEGGDTEAGSRAHRSRSATSSTARSLGLTASPPSSPRSPISRRSRFPSTASAADSLGTPSSSPDLPAHDRFPSAASTAGESTSSHALAKLRSRLDSDQAAREAHRVQEAHARAAGGKLRKKLPREVVEGVVERVLHAQAGVHEAEERAGDDEAWLEEMLAALPQPPPPEELLVAVGERDVHEDGKLELALDRLDAAASPAHRSLLLAPARLGWRAAAGVVSLGVGTGRAVLSHVPLASTVGGIVGGVVATLEEDVKATTARLGEYASAFAGGPHEEALGKVPSSSAGDADGGPEAAPEGAESSSHALVRHSDIPLSPAGIAYRAVEFSLGVSLASVLVAGALTSMAWERVNGGAGSRGEQLVNA
ncbi:hypothetical protein JCM10449v2_000886 [Rhodotorula kratochvilovae]